MPSNYRNSCSYFASTVDCQLLNHVEDCRRPARDGEFSPKRTFGFIVSTDILQIALDFKYLYI